MCSRVFAIVAPVRSQSDFDAISNAAPVRSAPASDTPELSCPQLSPCPSPHRNSKPVKSADRKLAPLIEAIEPPSNEPPERFACDASTCSIVVHPNRVRRNAAWLRLARSSVDASNTSPRPSNPRQSDALSSTLWKRLFVPRARVHFECTRFALLKHRSETSCPEKSACGRSRPSKLTCCPG